MGVVYVAEDCELGGRIALKVLFAREQSIGLIKREFRGVRDIVHPNLVSLFELFVDEGLWFFTMELVEGVRFSTYFRTASSPERADVMAQLANGISAIHEAARVHCDIKPSNVLVSPGGHVWILDFGLVQSTRPSEAEGTYGGTPAYMSPELLRGEPPSPASDWYAAGMMILESFGEDADEVSTEQATWLSRPTLATAPAPFRQLCECLLHPEAEGRGSSDDIYRCIKMLGGSSAERTIERRRDEHRFVGRMAELSLLQSSLGRAQTEGVTCVFVHAPSGMGKSALVSHFLKSARSRGWATLAGKCYERESIPYKALDGIVERIVELLRGEPELQEAVRGRNVRALVHMFPPFERLFSGSAQVVPRREHSLERQEAILAFESILSLIARLTPLVLWIDDLQWGDADSAHLLSRALARSRAPILFVGTFRSEDRSDSDFLRALSQKGKLSLYLEIELGQLDESAAARMASHLLGDDSLSQAVVREAHGNPFLIEEIARYVRTYEEKNLVIDDVTLEGVMLLRLTKLAEPERRLLEMSALCSQPMAVGLLARASAGDAVNQRPILSLESDQWIRRRVTKEGHIIETYHDKIRETVLAGLSVETKRRHHETLFHELLVSKSSDSEVLFHHSQGAGLLDQALGFALEAGEGASAALAFGRAARWFKIALELGSAEAKNGEAGLGEIMRRLAEVLANGGHGRESAQYYLKLQTLETDHQLALEYARLAAHQLLATGYDDEGFEVLDSVLARARIRVKTRMERALPRLLFERFRVFARGLSFVERAPAEVPRAKLLAVDASHIASAGLLMGNPVHGAVFGAINLRLALDAGEPRRLARALSTELLYSNLAGEKGKRKAEHLGELAQRLVDGSGDPFLQGYLLAAQSSAALLRCEFVVAEDFAQRASAELAENCVGVTWELNLARCLWAPPLILLGRWGQMIPLLETWLEDARDRQDQDILTRIGAYPAYGMLAQDRPEEARDNTRRFLENWPRDAGDHGRYAATYSLAAAECYRANAPQELERIATEIDTLKSSILFTVPFIRTLARQWANLCDLQAASLARNQQARLLSRVKKRARGLKREGPTWATALYHQAEASMALIRGQDDLSLDHLRAATERFDDLDMRLFGAAMRYRLGLVEGGDAGKAQMDRAVQVMIGEGVSVPERFARIYCPYGAD